MAEWALDETTNGTTGAVDQGTESDRDSAGALLERTQEFADELARRPNLGLQAAPLREVERLGELGLLTAPLPRSEGGLALGVEPGSQGMLLRVLATVGGGDLALGRLYEGHVNGLLMVIRYGSPEQIKRLAEDCRRGMLSGVWNTGAKELMRIDPEGDGVFRYQGMKTFATGAAFVRRPIVTADLPGHGWQMTMPRMEAMDVKIDRSFWHPLGMESSESFGIDFTGERIEAEDLIGRPGDFYKDPLFRGGAIRFAAVQAGAAMRLHALFADWLRTTRRGEDPYQVARLGEVAMLSQQTALWIEKAGTVAEECLFREDEPRTWRMVECANMTRLAIERICTQMMQLVTAGVGAHGLLQPARFERVIRDLTMYLRQPAPDQTLADVGKASLWKGDGVANGFWNDGPRGASLTPEYFRGVYERNPDPWDFETSSYEAGKYEATLESLPRNRYHRGLEVGCSIGVLTEQLAERCGSLLALDVSDRALGQARKRLIRLPDVEVRKMHFPQQVPEGMFDLIVISEVAYYWHMADLERAADRVAPMQRPGAHLVLVHWTPQVRDYPLTGDAVHDYWISRPEWRVVRSLRQERFRLDVLEKK
ncbi:SAM-dependent methyltransferase [Granulicella sibirica]|uniref:Methyltransferase type 12 n=1 Tax=Granulicella sibirica TaxID=2479048 RepID=A0A4Q0T5D4_9BACT|nr:SAM-dependent methyltransferase [Granulicella sibirica]RXH56781.1 Methyltransferase type 12 [Granulicella sibirica]